MSTEQRLTSGLVSCHRPSGAAEDVLVTYFIKTQTSGGVQTALEVSVLRYTPDAEQRLPVATFLLDRHGVAALGAECTRALETMAVWEAQSSAEGEL